MTTVEGFCKYTSAHGWGRVVKSSGPGAKLLWAAITLSALGMMVIHVFALTALYVQFSSEYKLHTSIRLVEFPSVTICNLLPMSSSTKRQLLKDRDSQIFRWERVLNNLDWFDGVAGILDKEEEFELAKMRLKEPSGYFDNIGDESYVVGHQFRDFVLGCTVGTEACAVEANFTLFQTRDFFNCYTFNGGTGDAEVLTAKVSGPSAGLSLILYLENSSGDRRYDDNDVYHPMWNLGNSAGVRLVIHAPHTRPNPAEEGFNVPPGNSANVALGVRSYSRLDSPYGDCVHVNADYAAQFVYSMSACLSLCSQVYIVGRCNCLSSIYPIPTTLSNPDLNLTYCAKWDVENAADFAEFFNRVDCEMKSKEEFVTHEQEFQKHCGCYPPCSEIEYTPKVSYAYWPVDYIQESFFQAYVLQNPNYPNLKAYDNLREFNRSQVNISQIIERGLIADNFVRINIFLESSVVEDYTQKASYSLANFVSSIGGTFGLWIGMSVITWCEVVQLVCNLAYLKVKNLSERVREWKRDKKGEEEETKN